MDSPDKSEDFEGRLLHQGINYFFKFSLYDTIKIIYWMEVQKGEKERYFFSSNTVYIIK